LIIIDHHKQSSRWLGSNFQVARRRVAVAVAVAVTGRHQSPSRRRRRKSNAKSNLAEKAQIIATSAKRW